MDAKVTEDSTEIAVVEWESMDEAAQVTSVKLYSLLKHPNGKQHRDEHFERSCQSYSTWPYLIRYSLRLVVVVGGGDDG